MALVRLSRGEAEITWDLINMRCSHGKQVGIEQATFEGPKNEQRLEIGEGL